MTASVGSWRDSAVLDATCGRNSVARRSNNPVTAADGASCAAAWADGAAARASAAHIASETVDASADR